MSPGLVRPCARISPATDGSSASFSAISSARLLRKAIFFIVLAAASSVAQSPPSSGLVQLYQQLGSAGLDTTKIYRIRDAAIDRPGVHLTFSDGLLGFTREGPMAKPALAVRRGMAAD